jgi:hypothetical protein
VVVLVVVDEGPSLEALPLGQKREYLEHPGGLPQLRH